MSFVLAKRSYSGPVNITVQLERKGIVKGWEVSQLSKDTEFVVDLRGKSMDVGRNRYKLKVDYKDKNGKEYDTEQEFYINLVDVTFFQRIKIILRNIVMFFVGLVL